VLGSIPSAVHTMALSCPAGTTCSKTLYNTATCVACPGGTFTSAQADIALPQLPCHNCAVGKYSAANGSACIDECGQGEFRVRGATVTQRVHWRESAGVSSSASRETEMLLSAGTSAGILAFCDNASYADDDAALASEPCSAWKGGKGGSPGSWRKSSWLISPLLLPHQREKGDLSDITTVSLRFNFLQLGAGSSLTVSSCATASCQPAPGTHSQKVSVRSALVHLL